MHRDVTLFKRDDSAHAQTVTCRESVKQKDDKMTENSPDGRTKKLSSRP